jgi:hypothetical protein
MAGFGAVLQRMNRVVIRVVEPVFISVFTDTALLHDVSMIGGRSGAVPKTRSSLLALKYDLAKIG